MWPRLGSFPTYGLLYGVSILSHFVVGWLIARYLGLSRRVWIGAGVCYLAGMTLGAKALYDILDGGLDPHALLSAEHYIKGGLWGGLLVYIGLAAPLSLVLSKRRGAALDLVALTIPIPWIFAKLGCLFNGCCYGRACSMPWAITFREGVRGAPAGVPVHPTQIYEILLVVFIMLIFVILRHRRWQGTMILWFSVVYGFGRALSELWRGDLQDSTRIGPVSLSQLVCIAAAGIAAVVLLFWHGRQSARDAPPVIGPAP